MDRKYGRVRVLKAAASLLFLGLVLFRVEWKGLAGVLRGMDAAYVAASILLSFGLVACSCWKWWVLLVLLRHRVSFFTLYRWYFVGYFFSNFLPSNVGGDLARAALSGRRIRSHSASLVAIFAERVTGMVVLLLAAALSPFLRPGLIRHPTLAVPAAAACGLLAGLAVLPALVRAARRNGPGSRLVHFLRRAFRANRPGRPAAWFDASLSALESFSERASSLFRLLRSDPRAFWPVAGLTLLFYALTVLNVMVAGRAFGVWPDATGVLATLPAALMVASLPIALGSLGLAEGAYVHYFGLIGLSGELTLAMGLLLRLKILLLGLVGLVVQIREPVSFPARGPGGASHA